jgi:hypothetical protein
MFPKNACGYQTSIEIREPVNCDRSRIGQLTSNLIGNALQRNSTTFLRSVDSTAAGAWDRIFGALNAGWFVVPLISLTSSMAAPLYCYST